MSLLYAWLNENLPLVIFVYGLAFFLVGFAILLQDRSFSHLHLAACLPWLGASALIHGLAEWGLLFVPMQQNWMGEGMISLLWVMETFLWGLSFFLLCLFGARLLAPAGTPWLYSVSLVFLLIFLGWLAWWAGLRWARPDLLPDQWLRLGNIWSRYLLAAPGAVVTAAGLWRQQSDPRLATLRSVRQLRLAVAFFLSYGFLGGLVVPPADFFPASMLNTQAFFRLTGLPVQVLRSLAAVGIAYSIIKVLHIFHLEHREHFAEAVRWQALGEERERIARDLHDGAIQSLYAVTLYLQRLKFLPPGRENWERELELALGRLDLSIKEMRRLVAGLREDATLPLAERLRGLVQGFASTAEASVSFSITRAAWEPSPELAHEIYLMVRESLSNAGRHACASRVEVAYEAGERGVRVEIADNGIGFRMQPALRQPGRYGLRNLLERARLVGAQVSILSVPGSGTRVIITAGGEEVIPRAEDQVIGG